MTDLADIFGADGHLARAHPGYRPRFGQVQMAKAVRDALRDREHLNVDAPTGVGKSYGYLAPSIEFALERGLPVLVATSSRALQEQLARKDLPALQRALPDEFAFSVLKGRSNYLCQHRVTQAWEEDGEHLYEAERVRDFAAVTQTGDVVDLDLTPWARQRFTVGPDECLHRECPAFAACFYEHAKARAAGVQIAVTNHAFLFTCLAVLAHGGPELLPPSCAVVLDEADRAAAEARRRFGYELTTGRFNRLARRLPDASEFTAAVSAFFKRLSQVDSRDGRLSGDHKIPWLPLARELRDAGGYFDLCASECEEREERQELRLLSLAAGRLEKELEQAMTQSDKDYVYYLDSAWAEGRGGRRFPVNKLVADCVRPGKLVERWLLSRGPVICTSATLAVSGGFDHLERELGVPAHGVLVSSPFDLSQQMMIAVPDGIPRLPRGKVDPAYDTYMDAVEHALREVIRLAHGRTLVILNARQRLLDLGNRLGDNVYGHRLYVQGRDGEASALVAQFRDDVSSVLLGLDSLRSGVDVIGPSLSACVLESLPFAHPANALVNELAERAEADGENAWTTVRIPFAVGPFRQGVGRLIRSETDRGVLVVLDRRLLDRRYGAFLRFLGGIPVYTDLAAISYFLGSDEAAA